MPNDKKNKDKYLRWKRQGSKAMPKSEFSRSSPDMIDHDAVEYNRQLRKFNNA